MFCNAFASELLVPIDDFSYHYDANVTSEDLCKKLSKRYFVSREVIARKLFDNHKITKTAYERLANKWTEEFLEKRKPQKEKGGPDFFKLSVWKNSSR